MSILRERILGNLHGFSRVCVRFLGGKKTDSCLNGQQIGHTFLSDKRYSTVFVERMRLCAAIPIQNSTHCRSRLELKVMEKIHIKIREDVQTTPIEVTTSSSDVADKENFFFTQIDGEDETEEQTLERKTSIQEKGSRIGSK